MYKSENTFRNFGALVAGVLLGAMAMLPILGYLGFVNAHLKRENQELHARILTPTYQSLPALKEYPTSINVYVEGTNNSVEFAYTETGGAAGDVTVTGTNGTTTIYLGAGQMAQVTNGGTNNTIYIASQLKGLVSCTNTGTNGSVEEGR